MSRAILCLVFVAILASIGHGRVIEKRSPGVADFADQIDEAVDLKAIGGHIDTAIDAVGDFGSDAIDEITDFANSDGVRRVGDKVVDVANDVGDAFVDAGSAIGDFFGGLGRKKRSPGFADFADKIDEAVDLRDVGGHIDTAIDAVGDFGSDAIDEITDFANSDGVRRVGDKVVDVANGVGDAFVDAGSAIGDFFGGLGRKKRSPGFADFADKIDEAVDLRDIGGHIDTAIDAVGDFGSDAIDEITDFANSDGVRRVGDKVVDVANDVGDAFVDAGSAIGDFFGGLGRKKRSSEYSEDLGPGQLSDIWDRIEKGAAVVGKFPILTEAGSGGGIRYVDLGGPFKNLVLKETRAYAAEALGKFYGNLLYQSFN